MVMVMDNKEKDLLKRISDLCYQSSEEIYDDSKENGTGGILNLCDQFRGIICLMKLIFHKEVRKNSNLFFSTNYGTT